MRLRQFGATRLEMVLALVITIALIAEIGYLFRAWQTSAAEAQHYSSELDQSRASHAKSLIEKQQPELELPLPHGLCAPPLVAIWVRSTTGKLVPGCRQLADPAQAAPAQEPAK
jgi:hypothetical protein